ncbi:MAG: hypothetical protein GY793_05835 [Proteobacteria bacterium]|nr:hypothetical protein [Pseudomonadota bacterium]
MKKFVNVAIVVIMTLCFTAPCFAQDVMERNMGGFVERLGDASKKVWNGGKSGFWKSISDRQKLCLTLEKGSDYFKGPQQEWYIKTPGPVLVKLEKQDDEAAARIIAILLRLVKEDRPTKDKDVAKIWERFWLRNFNQKFVATRKNIPFTNNTYHCLFNADKVIQIIIDTGELMDTNGYPEFSKNADSLFDKILAIYGS